MSVARFGVPIVGRLGDCPDCRQVAIVAIGPPQTGPWPALATKQPEKTSGGDKSAPSHDVYEQSVVLIERISVGRAAPWIENLVVDPRKPPGHPYSSN